MILKQQREQEGAGAVEGKRSSPRLTQVRSSTNGLADKKTRTAAPLLVPPTKGSRLAVAMKEEEEKLGDILGWKYEVVKRGGRSLADLLTKSNIFAKEYCGRQGCRACEMSKVPLDCRRRSILYETECVDCRDGDLKIRMTSFGHVYVKSP